MSNKRLYKSTVNCMLCGVCGGIAEYFDIDQPGPPGLGNPDLLRRRRNLGIYYCSDYYSESIRRTAQDPLPAKT